jgi:formylglycine-generating enzyme required for sulfatase activity
MVAQFTAFQKKGYHVGYSPSVDCPINGVTAFEAMAYCRWLSEQAGIAEEDMCYPPLDGIRPGMELPGNYLSRTGYRLPTEAEWEFACRGGVRASRSFGESEGLLSAYAWTLHNSDDRSWPVGRLKPNGFGLFDMHGNIGELCHGDRAAAPASLALTIQAGQGFPRRGGDFGDARQNVRSARRHMLPADAQWGNTGFRIARTMPSKGRQPSTP